MGKIWIRRSFRCTIAVHLDPSRGQSRGLGAVAQVGWVLLSLAALTSSASAADGASASASASAMAATQERRAARGWLELEQEQRAYRDRVAPLDLKEQRLLESLERSQRLELRGIQLRNARELERRERQRRLESQAGAAYNRMPRWDTAAEVRRRAERFRATIRSRQDRLPFSRR